MRWKLTKEADAPLDAQITGVLQEMNTVGVSSDDYPKYMGYLEQLNTIKAKSRRDPMSRDTIAQIFGNVAITLIIVAYEQKHVLSSKAFGQFLRTGRD